MKTTDRKEFDFRKGITIYSNHEGKEAWKEGDQIYHAVLNQEYLSSSPTLMSFVKIALSCLDENNLVNLLPGENMPVDAKVGIIYQPSYAVAALAIGPVVSYNERIRSARREESVRNRSPGSPPSR